MKKIRKIIEIDENRCTGCGLCITSCAEGALKLVDGKAKLVSDVYCDGLGACLGECPEGALKIIDREAEDFSEEAVEELKTHQHTAPVLQTMPCGCPSSMAMSISPKSAHGESSAPLGATPSELTHWPIKLQLLAPTAPFLKDTDLVLLADCCAASQPDLHRTILKGKSIALGCPKLDNIEAHVVRLSEILKSARPRSLTVVHMEVPCCFGFVQAALAAAQRSGVNIPIKRVKIARTGAILEEVSIS
ncbi:MAG TPA: 4Fe-4S binding protein [Deltaproteobacteria bacterium]|nr:4Fe-4S binding protein [Deltaproteobacteria bacterium]